MMYIVKWEECYLTTGGAEARTTLIDFAQRFKSFEAAKARVLEIKRFRVMTNYSIVGVSK